MLLRATVKHIWYIEQTMFATRGQRFVWHSEQQQQQKSFFAYLQKLPLETIGKIMNFIGKKMLNLITVFIF